MTTPTQRLRDLRYEIETILDKGIAQFLLPYADSDVPLYIYVQGYTPGFNDGEPCIHNSYAYTKEDILEDEMMEYERAFFGKLTEEDIENSRDIPDDEDFNDAIDGVLEALNYKYETDFQVLITLQNGNVSYVRDHYDCGF